MAVFDLFSKRQKRLRGDGPDVYTYDNIPRGLRVQIVHIWMDALGRPSEIKEGMVRECHDFIVTTLCKEYGVFSLPGTKKIHGYINQVEELHNFLLIESDFEKLLDSVELSFRLIDGFTRKFDYLYREDANDRANNALNELNERFKEHGIGYQFQSGEIIRIDSELLHAETVKPALRLLNQKAFAGPQQEFLKAHEHYRHGNNKEALNECLKAFESLMKAICDKRKWTYPANATAKPLIKACFDNNLVPLFWQNNLSSLSNLLEGSVPTGRNKLAGHGQGSSTTSVPGYLTAYMLHMTASTLVFLCEADAAMT